MKFAYLLLLSCANAVRLSKKPRTLAQLLQEGPTAEQLMAAFDTVGDGAVTKDEAENVLEAICKEHGPCTDAMWAEAEANFDKADANHDGKITLQEIKTAMA